MIRKLGLIIVLGTALLIGIVAAQDQVIRLNPIWSPDGQHIAYMASDGIHVMDQNGENNTTLTPPTGFIGWTPDSSGLLIAENNTSMSAEIWIYPLDGGEPVQLFPEIGFIYDLAYSHDGSRVAISGQMTASEPPTIWIADGRTLTEVGVYSSYDVQWTADDSAILVQTQLEAEGGLRAAEVTIVATPPYDKDASFVDVYPAVQLSNSLSFTYDPAQSAPPHSYALSEFVLNGGVLAAVNQRVSTVTYAEASGTVAYIAYCDPAAVSESFLQGEWSADEQSNIATALYTVDVATGEINTVIPCGSGSQFSVSFSPDGQHLVMVWVQGAQWDVYRVDLQDGNLVNLTTTS